MKVLTKAPMARGAQRKTNALYMKHVMIDQETLGVTADAIIVSIGAVKFDLESGAIDDDGYYAVVACGSEDQPGRRIDGDTLAWWMRQSEKARAVFNEPQQPLETALMGLTDWLVHNKRCAWSNGADFDLPMLMLAYRQLGMEPPWLYHNTRCVRTYKSLPGADRVAKPAPKIAHHALYDAIAQAQYVQGIHNSVFKKKEFA